MTDPHARVFKALGNPIRLKIFRLLLVEPLCNCELTVILDSSQSSISQHLKIMKNAGLIETFKLDQWIFYRAHGKKLSAAVDYACNLPVETDDVVLKEKIDKIITADYCSIRQPDGSLPENNQT